MGQVGVRLNQEGRKQLNVGLNVVKKLKVDPEGVKQDQKNWRLSQKSQETGQKSQKIR